MKPTYEELELVLKNVLRIGVGTMSILQKEMRSLNIEDINNIPEDKLPAINNLNHMMIIINNVLHPTFTTKEIYEELFKKSESSPLTFLLNLQKAALREKRIDLCGCGVCEEIKKGMNDEPQTNQS